MIICSSGGGHMFFSGRRHSDVAILFITVHFFRGLIGKAQSAHFSALPRDCLVLILW